MANLNEAIENDVQILERDSSKLREGVLAQVLRTVCWLDERNANNRKYRRAVWEGVFGNDDFKRKMENRQILGEYEHPESSALKLNKDRTSHVVSKMYFGDPVLREGKMRTPVKAVFDLLPTDAGKFIWILHEAGVRVGASTRADGSLEEKIDEDGSKYMDVSERDYKFVCIDHTGDASCQNTEPESIISSVRNHYEAHDINKNVAIALLESVQSEAAQALEKIIKEDKQHTGCKCKLAEKGCSGSCAKSKELTEATAQDRYEQLKKQIAEEKDEKKREDLRQEKMDIEAKWKDLGGANEQKSNEEIMTKPIEEKLKPTSGLAEPKADQDKSAKKIKEDDKPTKNADGKTQKVTMTMTQEAIKEELTTSSDKSGQPANLAASKEDMEKSKKRTEHTDKKMQDIADRPIESKTVNEDEVPEVPQEEPAPQEETVPKEFLVPREVPTTSTNIDDQTHEFLVDNWPMFMKDMDLVAGGDPNSKGIDATNNLVKVFHIPQEKAQQYVQQYIDQQKGSPTHNAGFESVMENYANDVIRLAGEIASLKENMATTVRNYSNDSIHFAEESMALKESITGLKKDLEANIALKNEAIEVSNGNVATIKTLTEQHKKEKTELNEKIVQLDKDIKSKETSILESEKKIKLLQEANEQKVKTLNEAHHNEIINLYVDYRVKGMGLKLHEKVLTLLRQATSTSEVDTLIRETQDALREGLTHSVNKISEVKVSVPVDKNQADINSKVGVALKHLTGL